MFVFSFLLSFDYKRHTFLSSTIKYLGFTLLVNNPFKNL